MSPTVRWVRYGRPAAEALRARVAEAKGDDPLSPVTVLVPSNHVGVATRRLLGSGVLGPACSKGIGLVAVNFHTLYRLAELLGSAPLAGAGRRPVSTPVLAAALRAALSADPGIFKPVAAHPATESALVECYRELRDLSSHALDALARTGERAAEVVRLHRSARASLERQWYDEQDLMVSAENVLTNSETPLRSLGTIIVYLPQRLARHSTRLLATAAQHLPLMVIAATTGNARADAEVIASISDLGANVPTPEPFDHTEVVTRKRTRFVTTSDADEEVRAAVRAVMQAVRNGISLDRIAILHASPNPYLRLLHEHLSAAGIRANGASAIKLSSRVAGRVLLQLFALAEAGFRRQDLFAWLGGSPVRHHGRWAPVSAWERLSRAAAVVAGRRDWDRLLTQLAADREFIAEQLAADPEEPAWKAERARIEAEQARGLRDFALGLIDNLRSAAAQPRSWGAHAAWAHKLLADIVGAPATRGGWPDDERNAAEKVELALDRLAALDHVEGPVSLGVFSRTLELELDNDLGRVGRFGEGVLIGSIAMGIGLDLDLVIVLGLAEGTFPARVRNDSLLPDDERETAGELPLHRQRIDREHRQLLAALAGAERHLLGVPRGDLRRSSERIPSRWAIELASSMADERWWSRDLLEAKNDWVDHVASFSSALSHLPFPSTEQEYRLTALYSHRYEAGDDPILAAGMATVAARRSSAFTRFDGNLAGRPIPSPVDSITSATRLERWAKCPFAYLLQVILRVEPVENPEEELTITPLAKGDLIHQALERFVKQVLVRPADQRLRPGQPWSDQDRELMLSIAHELCGEFEARGHTGRPIFWKRDRLRIVGDLMKVLDEDNLYRASHQTAPVAAELGFGFDRLGLDPVAIELVDGRSVKFRGLADRLDVGADGRLHVVDYKTGRAEPYNKLNEADPDLGGTRLQLPIYALAARQHQETADAEVIARYWFASTKGGFKWVGYSVTSDVLEHFSATLSAIVEGIEAGVFPSYPTSPSTAVRVECPFCDPDSLGVADLQRAWGRKRSDPALAIFAGLADPEVVDD